MSDYDVGDVQAAVQAGRDIQEQKLIGELDVPAHWEVGKLIVHDEFRPNPLQTEQKLVLKSVQSFIEYVSEYKTGATKVFVDPENANFCAVFDYHTAAHAGWCKHRAYYECPETVEWAEWQANNKKKATQEQFACFIEDHIDEIVKPTGSDMLQIATTLRAKVSANFQQGIRLDNGAVQFQFMQNIDGHAGKDGKLEIPEEIEIVVPLYLGDGSKAYTFTARFRWRIGSDHKLTLWYELVNPHKREQAALDDIVLAVSTACGVPIWQAEIGGSSSL